MMSNGNGFGRLIKNIADEGNPSGQNLVFGLIAMAALVVLALLSIRFKAVYDAACAQMPTII